MPSREEMLRNPSPRLTREAGFIGFAIRVAIDAVRNIFVRLFRRRHPANFDLEIGCWMGLDVNITEGAGRPVPRPLINRDCKKSILVYCYVSNVTPKCTLAGQLAALQQAIDQTARYLRDEFRCENPNCLQETGDLVWAGITCSVDGAGIAADAGAVLVRFRCIPEL